MIGEPPRQDRSEEEREAARLERERARVAREAKRQARASKSAGHAPKPATAGARGLRRPKRADADPAPAKPAAKRAASPPPPAQPPAAKPRRAEPLPREPLEAGPLDGEPLDPEPLDPEPRTGRLRGLRRPKRDGAEPDDSPLAARAAPGPEVSPRADARERIDAMLRARREAGGGPPGRGPGRGGSDPSPGRRRRRIVLLAVLALITLFALWLVVSVFQPLKGNGQGEVALTIPRGSGVGDIGELLEERGVISSSFFFELRTRLAGRGGDLKPGAYQLREDMSYSAAIDALAEGPSPNLIDVTFPEGIALREISPRVTKAGVRGNYARAAQRSPQLNPERYGARNARDLEGFLFPATYQLRRGATARSLVDKQVTTFKREFAKVDLKAARRANLTQYDVLIIASLVEREAQLDKERPIVASVIYNRLREGMNLGIDATVRYAANNWTKPVTRSQLASPSPYNTYNHPGLPPGPIGNPGLASMRAAARPASTKYLYYVVKPGTCGEHSFAESAAQHDRNVARYEAAREAAGGRSPTDC